MKNSLLGHISLCTLQLAENTLGCVIRMEVSLRWTCILPGVVILAGVEYRSCSDLVTVGITKLTHASETGISSPVSILQLGVVSQETGRFTSETSFNYGDSFLEI